MTRISFTKIFVLGVLIAVLSPIIYIYFIQHQPNASLLSAIKQKDHHLFNKELQLAIIKYKLDNSIDEEFDIDVINFGNGRSLAHAVSMHGDESMLETLIQYNSNLQLLSNDGRTALHVTAIYNSPAFLERLIETLSITNGYVDIDIAAHHEWTPLLFTILFSRLDNARVLLQNGADPNAAVKGGLSGVQLSIVYSSNAMTDLLIEYGAALSPHQSYYEDWRRRAELKHSLPVIDTE